MNPSLFRDGRDIHYRRNRYEKLHEGYGPNSSLQN